MNTKIIGICGSKYHGKDEAAKYLHRKLTGSVTYAFADPLKKGVVEWFGLTEDQVDGDKKEVIDPRYGVTPRTILQVIGTDWVRDRSAQDIGLTLTHSLWIERFHQFVETNGASTVLLSDVRFPDEVEAICSYKYAKLIHIDRSDVCDDQRDDHASENVTDVVERANELGILYHIDNNTTLEDLHRRLDQFLIVEN
jgi:hypothetical protein